MSVEMIDPDSYTLHFDSNGGTGMMIDQVIKLGKNTTIKANSFTKEDYSFGGWNTASDGSGTSYPNNYSITSDLGNKGDVITLYAQWFDDSYLDDTTELKNYTCEEEVKSFSAPYTGKYVLEVWGAQGGSVSTNTGTKGTVQAVEGGKGGYSTGQIFLNKGQIMYVYVGGNGNNGGWNGGGKAGYGTIYGGGRGSCV